MVIPVETGIQRDAPASRGFVASRVLVGDDSPSPCPARRPQGIAPTDAPAGHVTDCPCGAHPVDSRFHGNDGRGDGMAEGDRTDGGVERIQLYQAYFHRNSSSRPRCRSLAGTCETDSKLAPMPMPMPMLLAAHVCDGVLEHFRDGGVAFGSVLRGQGIEPFQAALHRGDEVLADVVVEEVASL